MVSGVGNLPLDTVQNCRHYADMMTGTAPSRLKMRRVTAGLTLDVLAKHTGIDASNLSRMERGLLPLTGKRLEALAQFYHVDPAVLAQEVA